MYTWRSRHSFTSMIIIRVWSIWSLLRGVKNGTLINEASVFQIYLLFKVCFPFNEHWISWTLLCLNLALVKRITILRWHSRIHKRSLVIVYCAFLINLFDLRWLLFGILCCNLITSNSVYLKLLSIFPWICGWLRVREQGRLTIWICYKCCVWRAHATAAVFTVHYFVE